MRLKYRVIERFRGIYPIEAMCEVFEVSRSGYYAWRRAQKKMPREQWLIDLIVQCQQQCNQTYGIRRVRRWIQRQKEKTVNLKALLRVMRKTNLLAQIRRRDVYKRQGDRKAIQLFTFFPSCNWFYFSSQRSEQLIKKQSSCCGNRKQIISRTGQNTNCGCASGRSSCIEPPDGPTVVENNPAA